nr:uncharacterized protein LOC110356052 [Columba livia]
MCVYSGIALHAPREQLLARVDREIMGTILRLSRVTQRETQLKLVLVQSVAEVSSAIQAVGDAGSFELSSKQEVTQPLLDWIKEEPADSGKLRPALSREENRSLRAVCCGANPSSPSQEGMKRGRTVRAALNMQLLHRRSAEGLGRLLETLLAAEEPSAGFGDVLLGHPHTLLSPTPFLAPQGSPARLGAGSGFLGSSCRPLCPAAAQGAGRAAEGSGGWGTCDPCPAALPAERTPLPAAGLPGGAAGLCVTRDRLGSSRRRAWLCLSYPDQMQVISKFLDTEQLLSIPAQVPKQDTVFSAPSDQPRTESDARPRRASARAVSGSPFCGRFSPGPVLFCWPVNARNSNVVKN